MMMNVKRKNEMKELYPTHEDQTVCWLDARCNTSLQYPDGSEGSETVTSFIDYLAQTEIA